MARAAASSPVLRSVAAACGTAPTKVLGPVRDEQQRQRVPFIAGVPQVGGGFHRCRPAEDQLGHALAHHLQNFQGSGLESGPPLLRHALAQHLQDRAGLGSVRGRCCSGGSQARRRYAGGVRRGSVVPGGGWRSGGWRMLRQLADVGLTQTSGLLPAATGRLKKSCQGSDRVAGSGRSWFCGRYDGSIITTCGAHTWGHCAVTTVHGTDA